MSTLQYSPANAVTTDQGIVYGQGMDLAIQAQRATTPWQNARRKMINIDGRTRLGEMMVVEMINSNNAKIKMLGKHIEESGFKLPQKMQVYKKHTSIIARVVDYRGGSTEFKCFGIINNAIQQWQEVI